MRRLTRGAAAVIMVAISALVLLPSPAAAVDGLDVTASTTYTVDFPAGVVRAQIELSFENTAADEYDGNTIISTYFTGIEYGIQGDATSVTARAGETPLTVSVNPFDADVQSLVVDFPDRLDSGERLDLVVNYDLPGHPPRSESVWRANEAFAAFVAYAYGDPGRSTVRVVASTAADVQFPFPDDGREPQISIFGDVDVYTFADIAEPDRFASPVVATDNNTLATSTIDVGGREVLLQAWPDDAEWATFVGDRISVGLPELERLIGQPIRDDRQLLVRESIQPILEGYGGWYLSDTGEIELGEELDPVLMYHELAHAWFNEDTSPSRWVGEGLAETYANLVMANTGETPLEPEVPAADAAGRQPLEDWSHPYVVQSDDAAETYGYATAFYVVDAVIDEIGTEPMADVLAAIEEDLAAYRGDGPPDTVTGVTDWRRFLDLLEQVGGSAGATELFRSYVVPATDVTSLDERSAARERYAQLGAEGTGWAAPTVVRTAMEDWDFPAAESAIDASLGVLEARDGLVAAADAATIELPDDLESRYEATDATDGLTELDDELATLNDAVGAVVAAETAVQERTPVEQLGLAGEDFTEELAAARAEITAGDGGAATSQADEVVAAMAGAEQAGRNRLGTVADLSPARWWLAVVAAAVALLVAAAFVRLRRGRRSGGVGTHVDPAGDAPVDGDVEAGVGRGIELDEDALAGAGLGGVDDQLDVAPGNRSQGSRATGVVQRGAGLADVGDPVLELHEDVRAVVDTEPVPGAQVLVDPNAHGRGER